MAPGGFRQCKTAPYRAARGEENIIDFEFAGEPRRTEWTFRTASDWGTNEERRTIRTASGGHSEKNINNFEFARGEENIIDYELARQTEENIIEFECARKRGELQRLVKVPHLKEMLSAPMTLRQAAVLCITRWLNISHALEHNAKVML